MQRLGARSRSTRKWIDVVKIWRLLVLMVGFSKSVCSQSLKASPHLSKSNRRLKEPKERDKPCKVYEDKFKRQRCNACLQCRIKGCYSDDLTGIEQLCKDLDCKFAHRYCHSDRFINQDTPSPSAPAVPKSHVCLSCDNLGCFSEGGADSPECQRSICPFLFETCKDTIGPRNKFPPDPETCGKCKATGCYNGTSAFYNELCRKSCAPLKDICVGNNDGPRTKRPRRPTRKPTKKPTLRPNRGPSRKSTQKPTQKPMKKPTKKPTRKPTKKPSQRPVSKRKPTKRPTRTPTPVPTAAPTELSPCWKCSASNCFRRVDEQNRKKCEKFKCATLKDCPLRDEQSPPPTPVPTRSDPTTSQSNKGNKKASVGQICDKHVDCKSNTCRRGVCMASPDCYPLKLARGTPFDKNKVNLVFVGSSFNSTTSLRQQVHKTYKVFSRYNMFSTENTQVNVFYVNPRDFYPSFCEYGCGNIERLLCCRVGTTRKLSDRCFPAGENLQTVVIHNSPQYGGAGYTSANMATTSTHENGPLVAIHEIGHSLFELADEYSYGRGNATRPNCAANKRCSKWSDLLKETPPGYDPVTCRPGCQDNEYFVSGLSFMDILSEPVGAVNERFSCCTYQALTKAMPSYCDAFNSSPNYLLNYCKNNDYQGYGARNYDPDPSAAIPGSGDDAKYIHVSNPMLLSISLDRLDSGSTTVTNMGTGSPGLYRKTRVTGDFPSLSEAVANEAENVVQVDIDYRTGTEVLFFSLDDTIEIPILPGEDQLQNAAPRHRITNRAEVLEIVLNPLGRSIERIQAKIVATKM